MPAIATKLGIEYRKVNGVLVKFYPQTSAQQVLVDNYTGKANLREVIADIDQRIAEVTALDALVFRGVVDGSHPLPVSGYEKGDVYRVAAAGTYAGQVCEVGDMITCVAVSTPSANSDWLVTQTNIDGAVVGPAYATSNRIAVYDGTTGKVIKDGGMSIADIQNEIDTDVAAHADLVASSEDAQDPVLGHVYLSDAVDDDSDITDGIAATPLAVKTVQDAVDALSAVTWALYGALNTAESADITSLADGGAYIEGLVETNAQQP